MNCPSCNAYLTCPCDSCLCEPRYAGTLRWVRLPNGQIECPVCRFTAASQFWCAANANDALLITDTEWDVQP